MRTVLTVAGIAIGVASVVMISNISECGTLAVSAELDSLGLGGLTVSTTLEDDAPALAEDELDVIRSIKYVEQAHAGHDADHRSIRARH